MSLRRGKEVDIVDIRDNRAGCLSFAGGMLAPFCEREAADESVLTIGCGAADWWSDVLPGEVVRNGTLVVAQPRDMPDLVPLPPARRGTSGSTGMASPSLSRRSHSRWG
jgi:glycine oxidase